MEKIYQSILDGHPEIAKIVQEYGRLRLEEYAGSFFKYVADSIQPREDLIETVSMYARRLLGYKTAGLLERHFADTPVALTANHHGVDYKFITVQGTIIFSLPKILAASAEVIPIVPVLACGIVPLSNYSFPRGIILSRKIEVPVSPDKKARTFLKVPLLPLKYSHSLVSVTGPITGQMVSKAVSYLEKLSQDGELSESERICLSALLSDYARNEILSLPDYSEQAVVLSTGVWKKMFAPSIQDNIPELAYLEMERVVTALLEKDIRDEGSLTHNLLFDPELRNGVLKSLDRQFGCWNLEQLEMLSKCGTGNHLASEDFRGCGTVFFWSVDDEGRRVPLLIRENGSGPTLTGIAPGKNISIPLTPDDLWGKLQERRLLPALFTSFTTLAFARGIKCVGGFFQVDYLPLMQQGLARVLESRGLSDWAQKIASVPTTNFVAGMNIALSHYPDGTTEPAGAVEIIAAGGLNQKHLEKIKRLTVNEAVISGLTEIRIKAAGWGKKTDKPLNSIIRRLVEKIEKKMPRLKL
ncbi:MAG TPA: hypothetical protein VM123_13690 [archaeon]|nr:hypothetical protein [archaeon]